MTDKKVDQQNQKQAGTTGAGYQVGNQHHGNNARVSDQNGGGKDRGNQQRNNQPSKGKSGRE